MNMASQSPRDAALSRLRPLGSVWLQIAFALYSTTFGHRGNKAPSAESASGAQFFEGSGGGLTFAIVSRHIAGCVIAFRLIRRLTWDGSSLSIPVHHSPLQLLRKTKDVFDDSAAQRWLKDVQLRFGFDS